MIVELQDDSTLESIIHNDDLKDIVNESVYKIHTNFNNASSDTTYGKWK